MKKAIILLHIVLCNLLVLGQESTSNDTTIVSVEGVNTEGDQIACSPMHNKFIYASNNNEFTIDDFGKKKNHFLIYSALPSKSNKEFTDSENILNVTFPSDIGTAFFNKKTNVLWFSSGYNFDKQKGKTLKIYYTKRQNEKWGSPKSFIFNSNKYNIAHPYMNEAGTQLFFSSDKPGGLGGMDIWYCNKSSDGWSDPIWTGYVINSKGNEIFPTWHEGDLYFSSDGKPDSQGLDIYIAYHKNNWNTVDRLAGKFNSPQDDLGLIYLDNNKGYFTSNRDGGKGGDDIYYFEIAEDDKENLDNYTLQLSCKETPIRNASIVITNTDNILITHGITNAEGSIPATDLKAKTTYQVLVTGVENDVLSKSTLNLINSKGEILKTYYFNKFGLLSFEYIPVDDYGETPYIDATDYSVLSLDISGQIYQNEPGDIGEGIPVYITSSTGEILALAYTSSQGQFTAKELRPLQNYKFVIKNDNSINRVTVNDNQSLKTIELEDNSGTYQRLSEDQTLKLLDENHNEIAIDKNEIFVIREIFYKFDSAELNEIAKAQLRYLSLILENNPEINIEIASHTDSRGTKDYNMKLSEERAKVSASYLEKVGIATSRLVPKGYGEQKLKNDCLDNIECEENLHAINRRTEIKIFSK